MADALMTQTTAESPSIPAACDPAWHEMCAGCDRVVPHGEWFNHDYCVTCAKAHGHYDIDWTAENEIAAEMAANPAGSVETLIELDEAEEIAF